MATAVSSLLVLLPEADQRTGFAELDPGAGLISHICTSTAEANRLMRGIQPDVLVAGRGAGRAWLRQAHGRDQDAFRILCVSHDELALGVAAVNAGDVDALLIEPFTPAEATRLLHHGCEQALLRRHTRSLVDELAVRNAELLGFNERLESLVAERTNHLVEAQDRLQESQRQMVQLETQSTVTHLLRGLAHEFNNPLAAIYGYAQRMRRQFAGEADAVRRLDVILQEVEHCRTVVLQLGQLATPLTEPQTRTDPGTVLRDTVARITASGRPLPRVTADDGMPAVNAAPRALALAFEQVLINAGDAGAGSIHASAEASGDSVRIVIENDGSTPDDATVANAIRPFFTNRAAEGFRGLGLSTAAALLREQDGTIELTKRIGSHGAAVIITLPNAEGTRRHSSALLPIVTVPTPQALTLVIDDEPMVAEILVDALREAGCHTATAGSFAEGMAELARQDVRALVVDLNLPDGSGLDLARRALALKPHLAGHIALTTGDADRRSIERMLADHGFPVLAKPFKLEQVTALAAQIR